MKKKIIKATFIYTTSRYIEKGIGFIKGIIVAKYLGPGSLGVWGVIGLIRMYIKYLNLGIIYSMNKEISINRDNLNDNLKIQNNSFTFILIVSLLILILSIIIKIFNINISLFNEYKFIANNILLIGIIGALDQIRLYFQNYFRAYENFLDLAISNILFSLINLIVIVVLINEYKLYSLLFGLILSYIITNLYLFIRKNENFDLVLDLEVIIPLLKTGFSLMLYTLGVFAFNSIDRIMITNFLSKSDMGYYTLAFQIISAVIMSVQTFNYIVYPKILNKIGNMKKNKDMILLTDKYSKYVTTLAAILIFIAYILINPFIKTLLVDYIKSIFIIKVILIGQFFVLSSSIVNNMLIAKNKQNSLVKLLIFMILISIILNFIMLKMGLGLNGIAIATAISYFLYGLFQLFIGFKFLNIQNKKIFMKVTNYYYKFLLLLIVMIIYSFFDNIAILTFSIISLIIIYYKDLRNVTKEFGESR